MLDLAYPMMLTVRAVPVTIPRPRPWWWRWRRPAPEFRLIVTAYPDHTKIGGEVILDVSSDFVAIDVAASRHPPA
jgi:hypothetical protein